METNRLNVMIGKRLSELRKNRGWSLDQAASATGVSKPMLAQIERGDSNPTISTLWKIASGFAVPFSHFLEEPDEDVRLTDMEQITPLCDDSGKYLVYPLYKKEPGTSFEMYEVVLKAECHYVSRPHQRGVKEYIMVREGELTLVIGDGTHTVGKDQSIRFSADKKHAYINRQEKDCRISMLVHYPTFP